ncbi:ABC transporter ATP-binding protein [Herbivorax sp. ANBcel31]|uniref:ATP-binding cassette domain-containing protein n=1 Tax=Herbivorax sp. ANBcel31 TaxID=3069754 RepID=UPI0027AE7518|nr:ABC transporter ATP-binding protein [Herbivorax sp. ANBcel31]MDQ2086235.1 ABC transporter ATP-binding protein [Herbivorax sp. ANBcel31]
MEDLIKLENVSKDYDGNIVVKEVNLSIRKGQTIGVIGANGTGKSTLLRVIAGLTKVSNGKRLQKDNIKINYVPEHFPKMNFTPVEYLHHLGSFQGLSKSEIDQHIEDLFDRFNMKLMKHTMIKYLSKGSMQKVAVIQSLMTKPDVLLLDEPLSGQDLDSQERFIQAVQNFKEDGVSIAIACHENHIIEKLADRVLVISNKVIHGSKEFTTKVIQFKCEDDPILMNTLDQMEGVIKSDVLKDQVHVYVKSHCSNQLLKKLLDRDCYIMSVNSVMEYGD